MNDVCKWVMYDLKYSTDCGVMHNPWVSCESQPEVKTTDSGDICPYCHKLIEYVEEDDTNE